MGARSEERKKKTNSLVGQGELLDRPKVLREGALAEQVVRDANHNGLGGGRALLPSRGGGVPLCSPGASKSYGFSTRCAVLCPGRNGGQRCCRPRSAPGLLGESETEQFFQSKLGGGNYTIGGKFRLFGNGPLGE